MKFNFKSKPRINKANGQINFSLNKKNLPEELRKKLASAKSVKFRLEDWDSW